MNIDDLIKNIDKVHWVKEVQSVELIQNQLKEKDEPCSVRILADLLHKNKTWVGDSLSLAIALRIFPTLNKEKNRYNAMRLLKTRKKSHSYLKDLKG